MIESLLVLGVAGTVAGAGLLIASKKFHVEKDERIEKVLELLPAANCGGCGYPGCAALAEAIVKGEASINSCPVGGNDTAKMIAEFLGVEFSSTTKKIAKIRCNGTFNNCEDKYEYDGPKDCHSIVLLAGGTKYCSYGCVGAGSCVTACKFNAIYIGGDGIPVVDGDRCTACGACVKACPRGLIEILPVDKHFIVKCRSLDKGTDVKNFCKVACIACKLCEKNCPEVAITVSNNIAYIDAVKCNNCGKCEEVCPTKAIVVI